MPVRGRPRPERAPCRGAVVADDGAGDPGQPALYRTAGVEPAADGHGPARPGQHRAGAPAGAAAGPARRLGDLGPPRAHPALVSEQDFVAVQGIRAARQDADPGRRYRLAGLLRCGICGRRAESCWSNNHPAYRCRHGYSSASALDPARPKNLYIREDRILPHLPALYMPLAAAEPAAGRRRRRTRRGADMYRPASDEDVIGYLRARQIALTYDPRTGTLQADTPRAVTTVIGHAS
jgi:Recombinase zinc beta ribbon domain